MTKEQEAVTTKVQRAFEYRYIDEYTHKIDEFSGDTLVEGKIIRGHIINKIVRELNTNFEKPSYRDFTEAVTKYCENNNPVEQPTTRPVSEIEARLEECRGKAERIRDFIKNPPEDEYADIHDLQEELENVKHDIRMLTWVLGR